MNIQKLIHWSMFAISALMLFACQSGIEVNDLVTPFGVVEAVLPAPGPGGGGSPFAQALNNAKKVAYDPHADMNRLNSEINKQLDAAKGVLGSDILVNPVKTIMGNITNFEKSAAIDEHVKIIEEISNALSAGGARTLIDALKLKPINGPTVAKKIEELVNERLYAEIQHVGKYFVEKIIASSRTMYASSISAIDASQDGSDARVDAEIINEYIKILMNIGDEPLNLRVVDQIASLIEKLPVLGLGISTSTKARLTNAIKYKNAGVAIKNYGDVLVTEVLEGLKAIKAALITLNGAGETSIPAPVGTLELDKLYIFPPDVIEEQLKKTPNLAVIKMLEDDEWPIIADYFAMKGEKVFRLDLLELSRHARGLALSSGEFINWILSIVNKLGASGQKPMVFFSGLGALNYDASINDNVGQKVAMAKNLDALLAGVNYAIAIIHVVPSNDFIFSYSKNALASRAVMPPLNLEVAEKILGEYIKATNPAVVDPPGVEPLLNIAKISRALDSDNFSLSKLMRLVSAYQLEAPPANKQEENKLVTKITTEIRGDKTQPVLYASSAIENSLRKSTDFYKAPRLPGTLGGGGSFNSELAMKLAELKLQKAEKDELKYLRQDMEDELKNKADTELVAQLKENLQKDMTELSNLLEKNKSDNSVKIKELENKINTELKVLENALKDKVNSTEFTGLINDVKNIINNNKIDSDEKNKKLSEKFDLGINSLSGEIKNGIDLLIDSFIKLKEKHDALEKLVSNNRSEINKNFIKVNSRISEQVEKLTKELQGKATNSELSKKFDKLKSLNEDLEKLSKEKFEDLKKIRSDVKKALDNLELAQVDMRNSISNNKSMYDREINKVNDKLGKVNDKIDKESEKLNSEIKNINDSLNEKTTGLSNSINNLEKLQNKLTELVNSNQKNSENLLNNLKTEISGEIEKIKLDMENVGNDLERLDERYTELSKNTKEINTLRKQFSVLYDSVDEAKESVSNLEKIVNENKVDKEQFINDLAKKLDEGQVDEKIKLAKKDLDESFEKLTELQKELGKLVEDNKLESNSKITGLTNKLNDELSNVQKIMKNNQISNKKDLDDEIMRSRNEVGTSILEMQEKLEKLVNNNKNISEKEIKKISEDLKNVLVDIGKKLDEGQVDEKIKLAKNDLNESFEKLTELQKELGKLVEDNKLESNSKITGLTNKLNDELSNVQKIMKNNQISNKKDLDDEIMRSRNEVGTSILEMQEKLEKLVNNNKNISEKEIKKISEDLKNVLVDIGKKLDEGQVDEKIKLAKNDLNESFEKLTELQKELGKLVEDNKLESNIKITNLSNLVKQNKDLGDKELKELSSELNLSLNDISKQLRDDFEKGEKEINLKVKNLENAQKNIISLAYETTKELENKISNSEINLDKKVLESSELLKKDLNNGIEKLEKSQDDLKNAQKDFKEIQDKVRERLDLFGPSIIGLAQKQKGDRESITKLENMRDNILEEINKLKKAEENINNESIRVVKILDKIVKSSFLMKQLFDDELKDDVEKLKKN